ncbi:oxidoreductase, short chain dehydrogenase/reductase family protein, partial [Gleimia coleocanis DSM 15436]
MSTFEKHAVVTGASTGIGEATVVELRKRGWKVTAVARRADRLAKLAEKTGCEWQALDLTDETAVNEFAKTLGATPVTAIVNNAGGALGVDTVASAINDKWLEMYNRNVMTALNMTKAFLPQLEETKGSVVFLTSTAAHDTYPGGAGYVAAKHAERIIANTLRLELAG